MKRLERQLKDFQEASTPRGSFKGDLWMQIEAEHASMYPKTRRFAFPRFIAAPVAVMIVMLTMGAGSYAYASPNVNEANPLYPVKRGIEAVEGEFKASPKKRAEFHARMMERRLAEAEVMVRNERFESDHLDTISNQLDKTLEEVVELKEEPEVRKEVVQHLRTANVRYVHLMNVVLENNETNERVNAVVPVLVEETVPVLVEEVVEVPVTPAVVESVEDTATVIASEPTAESTTILSPREKMTITPEQQRKIEEHQKIRNKMKEFWVRVDESDLTEDEKRDLLSDLEDRLLDAQKEKEDEGADESESELIPLEVSPSEFLRGETGSKETDPHSRDRFRSTIR